MASKFHQDAAYDTREAWLKAAETIMAFWIEVEGYQYPTNTRVACGFPHKGKGRGKVIGQCWSVEVSGDKHFEIFVSPTHRDGLEAAGTLLHEMVHATVGIDAGHKKPFIELARKLGLEGKPTHCGPGADTNELITNQVINVLGAYPGAPMNVSGGEGTEKPKKAKTYLIKCECGTCGYVAYTTAKWLENGTPACPDHGAMTDTREEPE